MPSRVRTPLGVGTTAVRAFLFVPSVVEIHETATNGGRQAALTTTNVGTDSGDACGDPEQPACGDVLGMRFQDFTLAGAPWTGRKFNR